jgi:UDP-glucuronate 4-epimerase
MIIHLAAQAGVRYSLINPKAYVDSNLTAFVNILENCRNHSIQKFIYASSSSVYGHADSVPFTENMNTDKPISLYAATKKSNELMACTYSHLFGINSIGLRFFTVYGPWGRPDMAPMLFAKAAMNGENIKIFNHGNQSRDFTFITDIISGIMACYRLAPVGGEAKVYNIGQGRPTGLLKFIELLEKSLSRVTLKNFVPAQPGDVTKTFADVAALKEATGYNPAVGIEEGIEQFSKWFVEYYGS